MTILPIHTDADHEAALAQIEALWDAADLGAAYGYGIAKNLGFADGNKRTGWILARLFLADNGVRIAFDKAEAVQTMTGAADGTIDEAGFAEWLRRRILSE